jgi:hypothetical protein
MKQEYDNTYRRVSILSCPKCHRQMEEILKRREQKSASGEDIERFLADPGEQRNMPGDRVLNVVCGCGYSLKAVRVKK